MKAFLTRPQESNAGSCWVLMSPMGLNGNEKKAALFLHIFESCAEGSIHRYEFHSSSPAGASPPPPNRGTVPLWWLPAPFSHTR
jgi:hypothetical protein